MGIVDFPHTAGQYHLCIHSKTRTVRIPLTNCDDGVPDEWRFIDVPEAVECECKA